jgi:hypothetical protein
MSRALFGKATPDPAPLRRLRSAEIILRHVGRAKVQAKVFVAGENEHFQKAGR